MLKITHKSWMVELKKTNFLGGQCGIKTENLKRMQAPPRAVVLLKTPTTAEAETGGVDRKKRATKDAKMIELAVFVDEVLYASTKKKGSSDPINAIQDIVFTYINSVSNVVK